MSSDDYFGATVKMAGDQSKIVISAVRDDQTQSDSGSVYIFNKGNGNTWSQAQRLNSPAPSSSAYFGQSIAYSKDTMWLGGRTKQELPVVTTWVKSTSTTGILVLDHMFGSNLEARRTTNWADGNQFTLVVTKLMVITLMVQVKVKAMVSSWL